MQGVRLARLPGEYDADTSRNRESILHNQVASSDAAKLVFAPRNSP